MQLDELIRLTDREILVQLRMAVAVLQDRSEDLEGTNSRLTRLESDMCWIKRAVYGGVPAITGLVGGLATWMGIR